MKKNYTRNNYFIKILKCFDVYMPRIKIVIRQHLGSRKILIIIINYFMKTEFPRAKSRRYRRNRIYNVVDVGTSTFAANMNIELKILIRTKKDFKRSTKRCFLIFKNLIKSRKIK